jgi:hypothetical protein
MVRLEKFFILNRCTYYKIPDNVDSDSTVTLKVVSKQKATEHGITPILESLAVCPDPDLLTWSQMHDTVNWREDRSIAIKVRLALTQQSVGIYPQTVPCT